MEELKEYLPGWVEKQTWNESKVFYITQLQLLLERKYLHWVTARAIQKLIEEKKCIHLRRLRKSKQKVDFVLFGNVVTNSKKSIQEYINQINWYSENKINKACGNRAEDLFELAMGRKGFTFGGKDTRKWKRREWKNSLENLDFIFSKDGKDYGFEVKNRFPYIKKNIIEQKLKICKYLKLNPVFVVREMPYSHQELINDAGGFVIRFSAKIFPDYFRQNVVDLYSITHLPVSYSKLFPEKSINLFISNFHNKI